MLIRSLFILLTTFHSLQASEHTSQTKDSIIQLPISISSNEIKHAILKGINTPLASGTSKELIQERLYKVLKIAFKVKYNVYLEDLHISFEGSKIKILSSYNLDFSLDYKQDFLPFLPELNIKGALDGKAHANLSIIGDIQIAKDATFILKVSEENIKTTFTKIEVPSILNRFNFMKIAHAELYFAEKFLEKSITKRIHNEIQKQILSKQVDIQLKQRIENLIYINSEPVKISNDLWLLPQPNKVSLSQVATKNNRVSNNIFINVGIIAQPQLLASSTKPSVARNKHTPIVVESFEPKVYLHPTVRIPYSYLEKQIQTGFNTFLDKNYAYTSYNAGSIQIYPSNDKILVAIDLVDKKSKKKVLTFYLWGTPRVNPQLQTMQLSNFTYSLDSDNILFHTAQWILDEKIKNFIQEKSIFNYSKKFEELSKEIASITKLTPNGILQSNTHSLKIQNIFIEEDALIITVSAKGSMSYTVNLPK